MLVFQKFLYVASPSFEKTPTPGQTKLEPRVHTFTTPGCCTAPDQILAMMVLRQHEFLSSKAVRLRVPCDACCIGKAIRTWFSVCSETPHSQSGEGARPHLCMDE